ncbi:MAG: hypothetical protein ABI910_07060 [Gemmatimonadota bacterium]
MRISLRHSAATAAFVLGFASGPFDIVLRHTSTVPTARAEARLVYAPSPFGIAVTVDGRSRYDVQVTATGLPEPSTLGDYSAYVAWEVSTDLAKWQRLGTITNGETTVGQAETNKFMLVITAEASASPPKHAGPTVLHGISPSGWLQSFMSHPLFRGISQ